MTPLAHRHPQLSGEELQQLKWLLGGVLTLLSVSTVLYLEIDAWILSAATLVGVGINLIRPAWLARIPRWFHRLAFPFVAAYFAADLWLTGELLPSMVRLDIVLLLYRSLVYRQKRDDLQLIVLGLFLVVVAGVLSVSMVFALHILVFAAVALVFLLAITLTEAMHGEAVGGASTQSGVAPAWARHVDWPRLMERVRDVTDWRIVALSGGLFVGLVVLSGALFLAIPRFQLENSLFLDRLITKKARTGFSESIRLGDVTDIQQDGAVALSVDISDRSQVPATPYWRMLVLDDYRDGTFRLSPWLIRDGFDRERSGVTVRGSRTTGGGEPVFWTFYLESGVSRYLPTAGAFEVVTFREPQSFRMARRLGMVALRNEPVTMTAYRVEGMVIAEAVSDPEFAARWQRERENPRAAAALMLRTALGAEDRAMVDGIAGTIATEATRTDGPLSAKQFAERASAWLGARHGYSLQPHVPAGTGDPLVRWLASKEGGHCELFAGSLVLLARAAGIPARVVTGFRGGSWNGYSNNFTLRNSDAHAWCEVFDVAEGAWVRADPTPGAQTNMENEYSGEAGLARRMDRSWTARLDSLRVFWYRRIVSFDQQSQFETLKAVKAASENSGRQLRETMERALAAVKDFFAQPWDARRTGVIAGLVALAAGVLWAGARLRFALYRFTLGPWARRGDVVRLEAGRWLARLRESGALLETRQRDEPLAAVVRDLQRLRYGARESWDNPPSIFRRARQLARESKRGRREPPLGR